MTALDYIEYLESFTPDTLDIEKAFSLAVKEELNPHRESPVRHLFALNGLGEKPPIYSNIGNSD